MLGNILEKGEMLYLNLACSFRDHTELEAFVSKPDLLDFTSPMQFDADRSPSSLSETSFAAFSALWSEGGTTSWRVEAVCQKFRELSRGSKSVKLCVRLGSSGWQGTVVEERLTPQQPSKIQKLELQFSGPHLGVGHIGYVYKINLTHLKLHSVSGTQGIDSSSLEILVNLTYLDLSSIQLWLKDRVSILGTLKKLETLRLHSCGIGIGLLAPVIGSFERLTCLDLKGNGACAETFCGVVSALSSLTGLRSLGLSHIYFSYTLEVEHKLLEAFEKLTGLTHLDMRYTGGGGSDRLLGMLARLPLLTHLSVTIELVEHSGNPFCEKLRQFSALTSLKISQNGFRILGAAPVEALGTLTNLKTLHLLG